MRTKGEIRAAMRARRRALTAAQRAAASEAVSAALLARADVRAALAAKRPFAVYLAAPHELDLAPFIAALWVADVTVAVPCWDAASARYVLGAYDNTTPLVEGASRIREPAEVRPVAPADIGVWIVPGLAFTRAGGRLGYGGGWYDRLLGEAAPGAVALGVAHVFQIVDALPVEPHDRTLSDVVSV